jgi:hypothetical protein
MEDVTMTQNMMTLVTDAYLALIGEWSQDQDQDLDSRLKDQIRSDLDLTKEEREEEDLETRFRTLAKKYGVDLDEVELSTLERNMFWFCNNLDTIRYPAAYIRKMVRDCGVRKRVGFQPSKQPPKEEDEPEITEIYGYPVSELDDMSRYLDYSTYTAILDHLPASSRIIFQSYEDVRSSRAKMRVFLAEGKKRGVV